MEMMFAGHSARQARESRVGVGGGVICNTCSVLLAKHVRTWVLSRGEGGRGARDLILADG